MSQSDIRLKPAVLEFRKAAQIPLEEVATTVTRGFEGYYVPIHFDAAALLNMVRVDNLDLAASTVTLRDGKPVGVALVARRGWTCRLATMSIDPQHRGQGIGNQLTKQILEAARQRGDRQFVLECIEQNAPALRLYHATGFKSVRRLVGYTATNVAAQADPALTEVNPASVSAAVDRWGVENLPWPMAPQTLASLTPPHRGYRLGSAWAIITNAAEATVTLRTLVVEREARRQGSGSRMVNALVAAFPGKTWRIAAMTPEELPEAFFTRLGFQKSPITQFQMERQL